MAERIIPPDVNLIAFAILHHRFAPLHTAGLDVASGVAHPQPEVELAAIVVHTP
jgi:hypothetical protein